MNKTKKKLTQSERETTERMHKAGISLQLIAEAVGKHRTSIGRELRRNALSCGDYKAHAAQLRMVARKGRLPVKLTGELKQKVLGLLTQRQSPGEICERLRQENGGVTVCAETIYRYIYTDAGGDGFVYRFTASRRRRRKPRHSKRGKSGPIPNRVTSVSDPPRWRS